MATENKINCDQVAWIRDALKRYHAVMDLHTTWPRIPRHGETAATAFLIELSEILGMPFDDLAKQNVIPREMREGYSQGDTLNVSQG